MVEVDGLHPVPGTDPVFCGDLVNLVRPIPCFRTIPGIISLHLCQIVIPLAILKRCPAAIATCTDKMTTSENPGPDFRAIRPGVFPCMFCRDQYPRTRIAALK